MGAVANPLKLGPAGAIALGLALALGGFRGRTGSFETDPVLGWGLVVVAFVSVRAIDASFEE